MKKGLSIICIVTLSLICGYYCYLYSHYENKENSESVSIHKEENPKEEVSADTSSEEDFKYYNFTDSYKITIRNAPNSTLGIAISVPQDQKDKQIVNNIQYSVEPTKIYDNHGNKVAYFEINKPSKETVIEVTGQVGVRTYDLKAALKNPIQEYLSQSERQRYTSSEKHIESDDADIIKQAQKLRAKDTINTVKNIYYFVQRNMRYVNSREDALGAKEALTRLKGKCMEYSALMVALCRANGIPARVVSGNMIKNNQNNRHSWVEVYLDEYGWVTFDPTILSKAQVDFSVSPHKYLISSYDVLMPTAIKLKIQNKNNAPKADAILMIEDSTTFYDAQTNQPLSE